MVVTSHLITFSGSSVPEHSPRSSGLGCRLHSAPNLSDLHVIRPKLPKPPMDPLGAAFNPPQASPSPPSHGLQSCRTLRGSPKLPDFLQRNPLPPILGSPTKVTWPEPARTWQGMASADKARALLPPPSTFEAWVVSWSVSWPQGKFSCPGTLTTTLGLPTVG